MAYNVASGEISNNVLYKVIGNQSVIYNAVTYNTGQSFRGVLGITTFIYTGSGTQEINEVTEFTGLPVEYYELVVYNPEFGDKTQINGFALEYELNDAEKVVNDVTVINSFAMELIDYPFFCFAITEHRYFAN